MKRHYLILMLLCGLGRLCAQTSDLSSLYIMHVDTSLQLSGTDSSYLFNTFALTQNTGGIDTVKLVCESYTGQGQWTPASDTAYAWSGVTAGSLSSPTAYGVCKVTDNLLQICLGRLYYPVRKRFTITLTGSNGTYTKSFIF